MTEAKARRAADAGADTPKHRELYRLLLAGVDLDQTIELVTLARERSTHGELSGPLLEGAAVSYARLHSDAPVLGALPSKFAEHGDDKMRWLHHQLLNLREKSVSHAALAKHPVVVHLYEQAAALELVSSELTPENLVELLQHLNALRKRIAQDVVKLMTELFPDRRAGIHLLVTG